MSLVRDARLFTQRVSAAPISGNIDNPEGGLDALMQVERERERVEQITAQFPFPKVRQYIYHFSISGYGLWK